jgi:hypothetical protein
MLEMSDRELLELAAKAAGIEIVDVGTIDRPLFQFRGVTGNSQRCYFNPLTDDGDAFRLASKVMLTVEFGNNGVIYPTEAESWGEGTDPLLATRLAIVRAAAEIGKSMEEA